MEENAKYNQNNTHVNQTCTMWDNVCRYVMSFTNWICVGIAWFKNRYAGGLNIFASIRCHRLLALSLSLSNSQPANDGEERENVQ